MFTLILYLIQPYLISLKDLEATMNGMINAPVLILGLAILYLMAIYVLLILAQRFKSILRRSTHSIINSPQTSEKENSLILSFISRLEQSS